MSNKTNGLKLQRKNDRIQEYSIILNNYNQNNYFMHHINNQSSVQRFTFWQSVTDRYKKEMYNSAKTVIVTWLSITSNTGY